jgi:pentatricopeptide repeat protein
MDEEELARLSQRLIDEKDSLTSRIKKRIFQKIGKLKKQIEEKKNAKKVETKKRKHETTKSADSTTIRQDPQAASNNEVPQNSVKRKKVEEDSQKSSEISQNRSVSSTKIPHSSGISVLPVAVKPQHDQQLSKKEQKTAIHLLNKQLKQFAIKKQLNKAKKLFQQVVKKGNISLDIQSYSNLLNVYVRCGDLEGAKSVFQEILSSVSSSLSPNIVTYTILLKGFCEAGMMEEASSLFFDQMIATGKYNIRSLNTFLRGCLRTGYVQTAEKAFSCYYQKKESLKHQESETKASEEHEEQEEDMKDNQEETKEKEKGNEEEDDDISQESSCYESMVSLLIRSGNISKAIDLLRRYLASSSSSSSAASTSFLLTNASLSAIIARFFTIFGNFLESKKYIQLTKEIINHKNFTSFQTKEENDNNSSNSKGSSTTNKPFGKKSMMSREREREREREGGKASSFELFQKFQKLEIQKSLTQLEEYIQQVTTIYSSSFFTSRQQQQQQQQLNGGKSLSHIKYSILLYYSLLKNVFYFGFHSVNCDFEEGKSKERRNEMKLGDYLLNALTEKFGLGKLSFQQLIQDTSFSNNNKKTFFLTEEEKKEEKKMNDSQQSLMKEVYHQILKRKDNDDGRQESSLLSSLLKDVKKREKTTISNKGVVDEEEEDEASDEIDEDEVRDSQEKSSESHYEMDIDQLLNRDVMVSSSSHLVSSSASTGVKEVKPSNNNNQEKSLEDYYRFLDSTNDDDDVQEEVQKAVVEKKGESAIKVTSSDRKKKIPICLEIGSGNGDWVVAQASAHRQYRQIVNEEDQRILELKQKSTSLAKAKETTKGSWKRHSSNQSSSSSKNEEIPMIEKKEYQWQVDANWIALELRYDRCSNILTNHFLELSLLKEYYKQLDILFPPSSFTSSTSSSGQLSKASMDSDSALQTLLSSSASSSSSAASLPPNNLAIFSGNAENIVKNYLKVSSISHIFVNYPQPPDRITGGFNNKDQGKHLYSIEMFLYLLTILENHGKITILSDNLFYVQLLTQNIMELNDRMIDCYLKRNKLTSSSAGKNMDTEVSLSVLLSVPLTEMENVRKVEEIIPVSSMLSPSFLQASSSSSYSLSSSSSSSTKKKETVNDPAIVIYRGDPNEECGHRVTVSSYFDRMWSLGQKKRRWFLYLEKTKLT